MLPLPQLLPATYHLLASNPPKGFVLIGYIANRAGEVVPRYICTCETLDALVHEWDFLHRRLRERPGRYRLELLIRGNGHKPDRLLKVLEGVSLGVEAATVPGPHSAPMVLN